MVWESLYHSPVSLFRTCGKHLKKRDICNIICIPPNTNNYGLKVISFVTLVWYYLSLLLHEVLHLPKHIDPQQQQLPHVDGKNVLRFYRTNLLPPGIHQHVTQELYDVARLRNLYTRKTKLSPFCYSLHYSYKPTYNLRSNLRYSPRFFRSWRCLAVLD